MKREVSAWVSGFTFPPEFVFRILKHNFSFLKAVSSVNWTEGGGGKHAAGLPHYCTVSLCHHRETREDTHLIHTPVKYALDAHVYPMWNCSNTVEMLKPKSARTR